jgi:ATP-dependent Clp protease adaptor protein ClpS
MAAPGTPSRPEHGTDTGTATAVRPKARAPRRWRVLLHNDDYTTMDFVVFVLMKHFDKSHAEATHVMLQVHHKGKGEAGVYPKDVAETKVEDVTAEARASGMPLLLSTEPVGGGPDGTPDP